MLTSAAVARLCVYVLWAVSVCGLSVDYIDRAFLRAGSKTSGVRPTAAGLSPLWAYSGHTAVL
eukprot:1657298-Prymnesium_polylepis.2